MDYLGSIPLQEKVTSLSGLQNPLRELYFGYKKITKHKKPLTGRLEISSQGLKVQYQGEKGTKFTSLINLHIRPLILEIFKYATEQIIYDHSENNGTLSVIIQ